MASGRGPRYLRHVPIFTQKQRRRLDGFRRDHAVESAALTPEERMRRSDELRQLAAAVQPATRSTSDESVEIIKNWRRHTRAQS